MAKLLQLLLTLSTGTIFLSTLTTCAPLEPASSEPAPDATLTIQTKKWTSLVDERFLSMSVDPVQLLKHAQPGPGALRVLSMATAMSPAYLRVAGPSTEKVGFAGGPVSVENAAVVNEQQWNQLQTLCQSAGLRPIVALSARRRPGSGSRWDSRDAMRVLAAADSSSKAPAGWQLGYDWTTLRTAGVTPQQLSSDLKTLRTFIEEFPVFNREPQMLFGPDVDLANDLDAASDFAKNSNLTAIVFKPFTTNDPAGSKLDKDSMNKAIGRWGNKKPFWIAESGGACTAPFSSALLWAQRLCTATRVGAQVILRELDLDAARNTTTPDLWVSFLHKALTSRGVLDVRASGPDAANGLSISSFCTPTESHSHKSSASSKTRPISPAMRYEPGAITVMAVNPTERTLRVSLKVVGGGNVPVEKTPPTVVATDDDGTLVHEYVLTPPNDNLNSTSTMLNGSPLDMAPGGGIPVLSPRQLHLTSSLTMTLPSHGVAFWVIPGAKARACLSSPAVSDVNPAASRLRPLSVQDIELGVRLDDEEPSPKDDEDSKEEEDDVTKESESEEEPDELPFVKDLRKRRLKLSKPSTPNLTLPKMQAPKLRFASERRQKTQKEKEPKTLDDFIKEETRFKPRFSRQRTPIEMPKLNIPSFKFDTRKHEIESEEEDREGGRKRRSVDRAQFANYFDEDPDMPFELDDEFRFKRKTMHDYIKEDLNRKKKKTPPQSDGEWYFTPQDDGPDYEGRYKRESPHLRPITDEQQTLRLARKPLAIDFLTLPKLPKKLVLPPAAKRTHKLLSIDGLQAHKSPEDNGNIPKPSAQTDSFPQGDVYVGTEDSSEDAGSPVVLPPHSPAALSPDSPVELPPVINLMEGSSHDLVDRGKFHYAPGVFHHIPEGKRLPLTRANSRKGELGEVDVPDQQISTKLDDLGAHELLVVPAAKPSKEHDAEIQSKLQKDLEKYYENVKRVAAELRAQEHSDESDEGIPPEPIDLERVRLLGEEYRKRNLLKLPQEAQATKSTLQDDNDGKEAVGKLELPQESRATGNTLPDSNGEKEAVGKLELPQKSGATENTLQDSNRKKEAAGKLELPQESPATENTLQDSNREKEAVGKLESPQESPATENTLQDSNREKEAVGKLDLPQKSPATENTLQDSTREKEAAGKLELPQEAQATENTLQDNGKKEAVDKEAETKQRVRRDLGSSDDPKLKKTSAVDVLKDGNKKEAPSTADLLPKQKTTETSRKEPHAKDNLRKHNAAKVSTDHDTETKMTSGAWEKRQQIIKNFKEHAHQSGKDQARPISSITRPNELKTKNTDEKGKSLHAKLATTKRKRAVDMYGSPINDYNYEALDRFNPRYRPVQWDSTGGSLDLAALPEIKEEDMWPFSRYNRYEGRSDKSPFMYPQISRPFYISTPFVQHGLSSSEEDHSSIEFPHIGRPGKHRKNHKYHDRFGSSSKEHIFDGADDFSVKDFSLGSLEQRALSIEEPIRLPNVAMIPWDVSLPSTIRVKRSSELSNNLREKPSPAPPVDLAQAIRNLHNVLNDDSSSSEERSPSVEVINGKNLIDSPETIDSLEDTIQTLLNMTKHLNATLSHDTYNNTEMVPWSAFDMNITHPEMPTLDAEEAKFRDAAMAWIHAARTGAIRTSRPDSGKEKPDANPSPHLSVKKELVETEGAKNAPKKLANQQNLTEQENIVSAMMQRVSALLSELRTIFNQKEIQEQSSAS